MTNIREDQLLREDGRANRARIQGAAREVFREMGPAITTNAVAQRAGVGRATLYRTYPTREAMLEEVLTERLTEWCELVESILRDTPDGEPVLEPAMHKAAEGNVVTWESGTDVVGEIPAVKALKQRGDELFLELVRAAIERGELAEDTNPADLVILFRSIARAVPEEQRGDPDVWERFVRIVIRGLRPET